MVVPASTWSTVLLEVARLIGQAVVTRSSARPCECNCEEAAVPICNVTINQVTCSVVEVPAFYVFILVLFLFAIITAFVGGWVFARCCAERSVVKIRLAAQEQVLLARRNGLGAW